MLVASTIHTQHLKKQPVKTRCEKIELITKLDSLIRGMIASCDNPDGLLDNFEQASILGIQTLKPDNYNKKVILQSL